MGVNCSKQTAGNIINEIKRKQKPDLSNTGKLIESLLTKALINCKNIKIDKKNVLQNQLNNQFDQLKNFFNDVNSSFDADQQMKNYKQSMGRPFQKHLVDIMKKINQSKKKFEYLPSIEEVPLIKVLDDLTSKIKTFATEVASKSNIPSLLAGGATMPSFLLDAGKVSRKSRKISRKSKKSRKISRKSKKSRKISRKSKKSRKISRKSKKSRKVSKKMRKSRKSRKISKSYKGGEIPRPEFLLEFK
jgi:hypothetical protein